MPPRLEGKGSCTQEYDTGDLPDQGKELESVERRTTTREEEEESLFRG